MIMIWTVTVTKQLFKKIPESLCKLSSYHSVGCTKPRSIHPSLLKLYNEVSKECVFNFFAPSIFVARILFTSSRGVAWHGAGVVPASNNWLVFGLEGGAGSFSVWLVIVVHCTPWPLARIFCSHNIASQHNLCIGPGGKAQSKKSNFKSIPLS